MTLRDIDERGWGVCHAVTSEGALILGVAQLPIFRAKVTYTSVRWVKVVGGEPIREERD
jgi:hypothetical protein